MLCSVTYITLYSQKRKQKLPHNCSLPDNQYMWPHFGTDWVSTHPLGPGSSCLCNQPGIDNSECFLRPDTGQSFCTGGPHLRLKPYRTAVKEGREFPPVWRSTDMLWGLGYPAVWLRLHRRHWGCHNSAPSIQSGTGRCMTLPAASTILHSCTARNHTSVPDSKKADINESSQ